MSEPFLGEIRMFSFDFAPRFWAFCNGQLLAINQNAALFSLLGTTYGGNGVNTFGLPNLQGRVPLHRGSTVVQGQTGGVENVILIGSQIPSHNHNMLASPNAPTQGAASGGSLSTFVDENAYSAPGTANSTMAPTAVVGANQAHNNIQPTLVINFCIALAGIFPSRN